MAGEGFVSRPSPYPVRETLDRLVAALGKRNLTVLARVDHAAGLSLRPTEVVILAIAQEVTA